LRPVLDGYKDRMTGHEFRGIASTVLHELGYRHDVIELQLAHQERNEVSAPTTMRPISRSAAS
jgi:hypothetical protein